MSLAQPFKMIVAVIVSFLVGLAVGVYLGKTFDLAGEIVPSRFVERSY